MPLQTNDITIIDNQYARPSGPLTGIPLTGALPAQNTAPHHADSRGTRIMECGHPGFANFWQREGGQDLR